MRHGDQLCDFNKFLDKILGTEETESIHVHKSSAKHNHSINYK